MRRSLPKNGRSRSGRQTGLDLIFNLYLYRFGARMMLKPHDDLHAFARGDNLDMVKAFQIEEMPVSGNDQCGAVFAAGGSGQAKYLISKYVRIKGSSLPLTLSPIIVHRRTGGLEIFLAQSRKGSPPSLQAALYKGTYNVVRRKGVKSPNSSFNFKIINKGRYIMHNM